MYMQLIRTTEHIDYTLGDLYINGTFTCYTLEDGYRESKVDGETRIPSGTYEIELRAEGGMTQRYSKRFSNHRGMLWLRNVKDFTYVYIHIGNTKDDTEGCILVGNTKNDSGFIGNSRDAYISLYSKALTALESGEDVTIEVI